MTNLKIDSIITKALGNAPISNFIPREKNSNLISIITINNCNLNCFFCRGGIDNIADYSKFKIMPTLEFQSIVDKCCQSGIHYFDLTPAIGEPFLDKDFIAKLQILEADERVHEYTVTSNILLLNKEDVIQLSKLDKLIFDVSLYGQTAEEYLRNTNRDGYDKFMSQLEMLYDYCAQLRIRFIQRCELSDSTLLDYIQTFRCKRNANLVDNEIYNVNRGGHLANDSPLRKRNGICPYGPGSGGGIVTGGDLLFCPFHDLQRSGVMGNINKQSLTDIYNGDHWQSILSNHSNDEYLGMCKGCDETW